MSSSESKPFLLRYRSSTVFILLTINAAIFTDYFLYGALVPVFPFALVSQTRIDPSDVQQWTSILLALYGGIVCLISPFFGYLTDHTKSRRHMLLVGLFFLACSMILLCVAIHISVLVLGRILQGLSGAIIYTAAPALIVDTVSQDRIGQAMGWMGWAMTSSILVSPLLGGVVYEAAGYRTTFAMLFVLLGFDIALRLMMIEKKTAAQWASSLDESALNTSGKPSQSDISSQGDIEKHIEEGYSDRDSEKSLDVPVETTDGAESSAKGRILTKLPPTIRLLTVPRMLVALWATFAQALLITSFDAVLPLFVKSRFQWTATPAGLIFLALLIPSFLGPLIGHIADRFGARWPVTCGFVLSTPGFICLRFVQSNSMQQKILLCALLAIIGLAITLIIVPVLAEIAAVVEVEEGDKAYAQGYGIFNFAFGGGLVAGPLIAGFVEQNAGWSTLTLILGVFSGASAVITGLWAGSNSSCVCRRRR